MREKAPVRLTIGDLARRLDLPVSTLRYYERVGLLPAPARSRSGYRLYDEEAAARLAFVRSAQAIGFTIKDIRELLALDERSSCPDVRRLLERRLAEIDKKLEDLNRVRTTLREALEVCVKSGRGCALLSNLRRSRTRSKRSPAR